MSNNQERTIQEQLEALYREYAEELPSKIAAIVDQWQQLDQGNWDAQAFADFHRKAHSLTGSGASFGFPEVSERARHLELYLKPMVKTGHVLEPSEMHEIEERLRQLAELTDTTVPSPTSPSIVGGTWPSRDGAENRRILLVEDDHFFANELELQIQHFGYQVHTIHAPGRLLQTVRDQKPAVVIMDVVFPEEEQAGIDIVRALKAQIGSLPPVILISVRGDIEARLEGVRAGASAYFSKPIGIGRLVDKLDELTSVEIASPYRVLIVDDDVSLAHHNALILKQAGILTSIVTDPLEVLDALAQASPDLILMDVYMPQYSGMEIARVVRQEEQYVGIPIVFLSTEADVDRQLAAMRLGGDDFLTKPIEPEHLISSVSIRAERSRRLRELMVRDSLTGLLNHRRTIELLEVEIARARRQKSELAFVMLDLDQFKSVNDHYGHMTGDHVLKSLGRMLTQRLRKTDIVGRYGGEEFALILPGTGGRAAEVLMNDLREGFAQIHHRSEADFFSVTFSCGIAAYPKFTDHNLLIEAADVALYQAKKSGRNEVIWKRA